MPHPRRPLVVIPTYNERENIGQLLPAIVAIDKGLHVLVVDDGSQDNTAGQVEETANRCGAQSRVFLQSRPGKLGLGSAYVDGFTWGIDHGYDFLIQMDADWSHHPKYLLEMVRLAASCDFVVGSRYVKGGGTVNWGAGRKLLSRFGSIYARQVLRAGFADFTGGFNGWWRPVLQQIGLERLRSDGYGFQIELKYRAHQFGFRHIEFPILFDERRAGKSKMSAGIALEACWRVWQLRFSLAASRSRAQDGRR